MPKTDTTSVPVRVNPAHLEGKGLEVTPSMPSSPEGTHGHMLEGANVTSSMTTAYEGDIVVIVMQSSGPTKTQIVDISYDEFVQILAGGLILTNDKGESHHFATGDTLVIPKGFTGTLETTGEPFRELVVIEKNSFEADLVRLEE